jgi:transposase
MPAKYVRPYSKGQKNDFRDAEAIAEAVQRLKIELVGRLCCHKLHGGALAAYVLARKGCDLIG